MEEETQDCLIRALNLPFLVTNLPRDRKLFFSLEAWPSVILWTTVFISFSAVDIIIMVISDCPVPAFPPSSSLPGLFCQGSVAKV